MHKLSDLQPLLAAIEANPPAAKKAKQPVQSKEKEQRGGGDFGE